LVDIAAHLGEKKKVTPAHLGEKKKVTPKLLHDTIPSVP
jgi:hypothetical protein